MTAEAEISTMGEKGQVVIPRSVRERLGIRARTKFAVYGEGDIIVLKKLQLPDLRDEWKGILKAADRKRVRASRADVAREVRAVRRARRGR